MNGTLIALVLLAPAPGDTQPVAVENALVLQVAIRAEVGDWATLEEIAEPVRDPQRVWPHVRAVVMATPGDAGATWGRILHRLRGAGLSTDRVRLEGPAVCGLVRRGEKP